MRFKYLVISIITLLMVLSSPFGAIAGWVTEDTPACSEIAVEPSGGSAPNPDRVHILYNDPSDSNILKHAQRTGFETWQEDTNDVDANGTAGSLALDSAGKPHVAFSVDAGTTDVALKYSYSSSAFGGSWTPQTVQAYESYKRDQNNPFNPAHTTAHPDAVTHWIESFENINLVLDSSGDAHISYAVDWFCDSVNHFPLTCFAGDVWTLRYGYYDSSWTLVEPADLPVDPDGDFGVIGGLDNSLALDSSSNFNLTHYNPFKLGSALNTQFLGTAAGFPDNGMKDRSGFSIKVNGNVVHISYIYSDLGSSPQYFLKYAKYESGSWSTTDITTDLTASGPTSLALDSGGNPHITYYDAGYNSGAGALLYTYHNGTSWSTPEDTTAAGTLTDISMVLDSNNSPHISYCGSSGYAHLAADADEDGIPDDSDNCPSVSNPDQNESDGAIEGMLAYWKFDVEEGLVAYDTVDTGVGGGNNDGTNRGAEYIAGKVNTGYGFTKKERDDVQVDDNLDASAFASGNIAVELWAWLDCDSIPVVDNWNTMIIKSSYGMRDGKWWWYDDGWGVYYLREPGDTDPSNGHAYFFINHWEDHRAKSAVPFTCDAWHHIVGMYDGQNVRIVVDGVEGTPHNFGTATAMTHSTVPILQSGT